MPCTYTHNCPPEGQTLPLKCQLHSYSVSKFLVPEATLEYDLGLTN